MKTIRGAWRRWRFQRNARRALLLLARLDLFMKLNGWPEWKRKQFWNDFIRSPRARVGQLAFIGTLIGPKRKTPRKHVPGPQMPAVRPVPRPPAGKPVENALAHSSGRSAGPPEPINA